MKIILVASVSKNGFIGKNNNLMWHLPNDLKRFKQLTLGGTIIMGRKTFESIGKILPERLNIVLTKYNLSKIKNKIKNEKNIKIISSLKDINQLSYKKIFIIGGEQIYNKMIKKADEIELTLIHKNFYGDKKFPKIDFKIWKKVKEIICYKDNDHLYNYSFIKLVKNKVI
ncbi:dihydrofolate reductase [Blattabacterium cuenoti]|uniref:dihydrofolate reductase n=1 Tax=Blattabacterium cuenoti TaxID=1653831 RepID=UPI00163D3040|nr:dihydrofolate reductase [Blattabacterium cuenoti]